jgi:hypothetical protein
MSLNYSGSVEKKVLALITMAPVGGQLHPPILRTLRKARILNLLSMGKVWFGFQLRGAFLSQYHEALYLTFESISKLLVLILKLYAILLRFFSKDICKN